MSFKLSTVSRAEKLVGTESWQSGGRRVGLMSLQRTRSSGVSTGQEEEILTEGIIECFCCLKLITIKWVLTWLPARARHPPPGAQFRSQRLTQFYYLHPLLSICLHSNPHFLTVLSSLSTVNWNICSSYIRSFSITDTPLMRLFPCKVSGEYQDGGEPWLTWCSVTSAVSRVAVDRLLSRRISRVLQIMLHQLWLAYLQRCVTSALTFNTLLSLSAAV